MSDIRFEDEAEEAAVQELIRHRRFAISVNREGLDFSDALLALKSGAAVTRTVWFGRYFLKLSPRSVAEGLGNLQQSVLLFEIVDGRTFIHPGWSCASMNLLATDWVSLFLELSPETLSDTQA